LQISTNPFSVKLQRNSRAKNKFFSTHKKRQTHERAATKMLSQFTIIKSYLDERSGREEKEQQKKILARSPYVYGYFAAWPHVLVSCRKRANKREKNEGNDDGQFSISHDKKCSLLYAYWFITECLCLGFHSFSLLRRGLNEIVDNQQFVLFLFSSPVPKKKSNRRRR
jgi:hypothetical protein